MALITQRICDHLENHEDAQVGGATENTYVFNGVTVKIDQCKPCEEPYREAFETLRLIGRSVAAPAPKRVKQWKPTNPELPRPFECPYCDKAKYTTLGRLAPHIGRQHKEHAEGWRQENGLSPL